MNGFRRWNHSSRAALVLVAVGLHTTWFSADAQEFPASPIRIFVPTAPATPPDIISRVIAAELASAEQWKVVVEDRPGAVQTIAGSEVLKQPANGTSIYAMSVPVTAAPAFLPNMPFDLSKDFAPVIKISTSYNVLVVHPSLPAHSVSELVELLKRQPDKLTFSSGGFGTVFARTRPKLAVYTHLVFLSSKQVAPAAIERMAKRGAMALSYDGDALDCCSYAGGGQRLETLEGSQAASSVAGCSGSSSKQPLTRLPCSPNHRRLTFALAAIRNATSTSPGRCCGQSIPCSAFFAGITIPVMSQPGTGFDGEAIARPFTRTAETQYQNLESTC
jgi:hypothetical protein